MISSLIHRAKCFALLPIVLFVLITGCATAPNGPGVQLMHAPDEQVSTVTKDMLKAAHSVMKNLQAEESLGRIGVMLHLPF